jgi:plasmid stabilization system protein ParE
MTGNDLERKPVVVTEKCFEMLHEAVNYLKDNHVPNQAEIMNNQFFKSIRLLETAPWIGSKYKDGMRKIKLGKFRYNIFYRELDNFTSIRGIWHTSRGTEFEDT